MDYIDYQLRQYNEAEEHASEMERLGFKTEEEYIDYIETKKADFQEAMYEEKNSKN